MPPSAQPDEPKDGNDLTSHRGSCLYRERIAKEEKNQRREWEVPVPVPKADPYDFLWLSSSPADYWTARRQQSRQADAANQAKVNQAKALARGPSTSSAAPARSRMGGPPRRKLAEPGASRKMLEVALLPMTTSERMAWAAQRRLEFGPSAADRLADEIAAEMCHSRIERAQASFTLTSHPHPHPNQARQPEALGQQGEHRPVAAGRVAAASAEHRALDLGRGAQAHLSRSEDVRGAVARPGRLHPAAAGRAIKAVARAAAPDHERADPIGHVTPTPTANGSATKPGARTAH